METLIYIFDLVALVVILYYSYANDKLTPGDSEQGPFRIKIQDSPKARKSEVRFKEFK